MNPETEHALIAVGSIAYQGGRPGIGAKIPFFKNRSVAGGWQNLDDHRSQPSQYEKGPRGTLRLDTTFYGPDGKPANYGPGAAPVYGGNYTISPVDNRGSPLATSPSNSMQMRAAVMNGQGTYNSQQGFFNSQSGTYTSQVPTFSNQTGTFVSHAPSGSLTHIIAHYGNGTEPSTTLRSGMGAGAYFNQSELARQPSDAYDPTRRQVNRASELSSISSGFGDGDIIIPEVSLQPPPPIRASQGGRFTWTGTNNPNRETVYTETSEDLPPRFRTVDSWVNQQTGRVKRAQARPETNEDVPPVPGLPAGTGQNGMPPEPEFTMMMPDNQMPRRPDLGPDTS
ncbi:hypothetical protein CCHL11_08777 [Colletotrichum chlorophyti]|uniref:Uncharacterized protein n=1 Tax=Colletotrichum chlorophyti TaxID=708187 RepID=A0A1Q8RED7_9PEZI|nr:hypothetical protein CCHL11_08777 [Colletotrichum chlorophyti]